MKAGNFEVLIFSDLYNAGLDDDGREFHAEFYYVVAEYEDGTRYAHEAHFMGCVAGYDDELGHAWFQDVREEAKAKAERLASRVRAAGTFNPDYWTEISAAYGSKAYQSGGWEAEQLYRERIEG